MKRILNITFAALAGLMMTSCELDFFPSDELSSSVLLADKDGAKYIMDGCYSMMKDEVEHLGYASGNTYVRHYFQLAEYPGDNICLSGRTTDPLYEATVYGCSDGLKNVGTLWWLAYKVIFSANGVIEGFKEGEGATSDQLIGEAYFLRALMHFHLVTLYAKPYVLGTENPGVVLRLSTNTAETSRATVGQCYNAVVDDLKKAAELMSASSARGNAGYANHDAALGLLSRVYLYMGQYADVIDVVENQLGVNTTSAALAKLDPDYPNYFRNALTSKETLFCLAHTSLETRGTSSIGSMYINDGMGWGEVYASDPLLNLYERYPEDKRLSYIIPQYAASGKDVVNFPVASAADNFRSNLTFEVTKDAEGWFFKEGSKTYRVKEVTVNGEYKEYKVNYGGEDCPARITKAMVSRNTFPNYFVSKFSYQDGDPMLSSPVFVRWGEVVLNLAEAYAQQDNAGKALDYVNVIRTRAGIPAEGLFAADKMHGYASALDIVLDERRMELAFEGHRLFDQIRVKRDIDRQYAGVQPWEVVKYTDNKIQYPIPFEETSVSGIPQNPY